MNRGFFPGGGFGGGFGRRPFFRPFPHPFFPGRFLFPTFFFSPFFVPFFREDQAGDMIFAQHQVKPGDTMASICHTYNLPHPILEEANPQIKNPNQLIAGETVMIPRISNMYCQKTYSETPAQQAQQAQQTGQQ
ncbi:LysM peptidoglycan-binding domain-containing protein [Paenibacillus rhizovicinus]|uniref:LysM peptidoglycan-binding domain-containing protein n=1 Tax=Paenibacillus rhizovicinus TaxID=2704463 RepID=A0A6C0P8H6_9BACL|nr:LysM domain-containing protein [Paenibacillus rhizovicinus]QHW34716.1 LysM peptidoglycan-binding domain-containing protein [Paenibacillus rhizovicinus]